MKIKYLIRVFLILANPLCPLHPRETTRIDGLSAIGEAEPAFSLSFIIHPNDPAASEWTVCAEESHSFDDIIVTTQT